MEINADAMWEYIRGQSQLSTAVNQKIPPALSWTYYVMDDESSIWFHTNRRLLKTFDGTTLQVPVIGDRRNPPLFALWVQAVITGPCQEFGDTGSIGDYFALLDHSQRYANDHGYEEFKTKLLNRRYRAIAVYRFRPDHVRYYNRELGDDWHEVAL